MPLDTDDVATKPEHSTHYDSSCKNFLSKIDVLALILQHCVPEYKNCTREEIKACIAAIEIPGSVKVDPAGITQIYGTSTEDSSIEEGTIWYDVRFVAKKPGENSCTEMFLNIEAQNQFSDDLLKRASYYVSRMISSQKGPVFTHSDYKLIRKVYSIWLCMCPPETKTNFVNQYSVTEKQLFGNITFDTEKYSDFNFIFVGLGDMTSDNEMIKALSGYFSGATSALEKHAYLDEAEIPSILYRKEIQEMCNLSKGIETNTTANTICRIMEYDKKTFEEAVKTIHISDEIAAICRPLVEKYFASKV